MRTYTLLALLGIASAVSLQAQNQSQAMWWGGALSTGKKTNPAADSGLEGPEGGSATGMGQPAGSPDSPLDGQSPLDLD